MLSYTKGKPFAIIRGGKKDGKILKIHDGTENNEEQYEVPEKKLKKLDTYQLETLKDAITNNSDKYLAGHVKKLFNKIKNNGDLGKSFDIDDGVLKLIPTNDPNQRDSIYITGPAGSGKSYFCGMFIEEYLKKYPKRHVILFSNKPEDESLDRCKPLRIPLNYNMVNDPIELDELENSIVVFDDIDQITDKLIQNAVWNLRDRCLEEGRSKGISICTVSHQITNYKATRICLNESDFVTFFPKSGARYGINYFLKRYAGLDKDSIKKIMDLPSRAVILRKLYPMCIIHQNGCYVL